LPRQLAFDLPARAALGRQDFLVAPSNARAVAQLEAWRDWPERKMVLCGATGAGKSHLAAVWAAANGALTVPAADLGQADIASLGQAAFLVLEDAEEVAERPKDEAALFHLYNILHATGRYLLLTSTRPPARWHLQLPDLQSRLLSVPVVHLEAPDDALLAALLVKLFRDRQISVGNEVISYLISRMDRSAAAAQALVAALDKAALSQGKPVSRRLAAQLLDKPDSKGA